jgi:guanosine-3',5'-bis(diphosphate) 3'-pyrophosphohydrolase
MMGMSNEITEEQRLLNEAIALAAKVHVGQVRKQPDGRPYICHVLDVVNALPHHMHEFRLVAALHDTIEDIEPERREWLRDEIRGKFGPEVLAGVEAISHWKKPSPSEAEKLHHYVEYVHKQVHNNPHAPAVKLADNYVNMKDYISQFVAGGKDAEKAREKLHQYASSIALLTAPKAP